MGLDFPQVATGIRNAVQELADARALMDRQAQARLTMALERTTGLATKYAAEITAVNAGATANPTNPAWQGLEAEKDLAVAARAAAQADIEAAILAFGKIGAFGGAAVTAKLNELA